MTASSEYLRWVLEQLEPVGSVRAERMFGGMGIRRGTTQFAIVMRNVLYFVVDDATRPRYEAAGMESFAYDTRQRRVQVRRYYAVPQEVLEDPDELRAWAEQSIEIAARETPRKRRA